MNKIIKSTNINSIEEFKACYKQELKEITEELNKNGVTNTVDVAEIIKLFFDEYYQYLSVVLASDREAIEEHQRAIYALTERKQFLKCFESVIPEEFYNELYQNIQEEIKKLNLPYQTSGLGAHICRENGQVTKKWYAEKLFPKLEKMISSLFAKAGIKLVNSSDVFIGSIIYNGHLIELKKIFVEQKEISEKIQIEKAKIVDIASKTSAALDDVSLTSISYSMPNDLFDGFNSYLLKVLCDILYLNTTDMNLECLDRSNGIKLTDDDNRHIGQRKKLTKKDLKDYLSSPINVGNFWKEKIITQFLNKAYYHPTIIKISLNSIFKKDTLDTIESMIDLITSKKKILSREKNNFEKIRQIMYTNEYSYIRDFCFRVCSLYNKEIYEKYSKLANDLNDYEKNPLSRTKANIKQLKSELLELLNSIKDFRIELAMEIFELKKEEVMELSNEELEKKYQELLDDMAEKAKNALERLTTNKQDYMRTLLPEFVKQNANIVDQIKSNIEKLEQNLKNTNQKFRSLADKTLQDIENVSICCPQDNYQLLLYILNKLILKYRPLIEPMIIENAKIREQVLLDNYNSITAVTPFSLTSSSNPEFATLNSQVTKKLGNGKN